MQAAAACCAGRRDARDERGLVFTVFIEQCAPHSRRMVFEGWVVDHLSTWLGHFLDIQRDQLQISLWRGESV